MNRFLFDSLRFRCAILIEFTILYNKSFCSRKNWLEFESCIFNQQSQTEVKWRMQEERGDKTFSKVWNKTDFFFRKKSKKRNGTVDWQIFQNENINVCFFIYLFQHVRLLHNSVTSFLRHEKNQLCMIWFEQFFFRAVGALSLSTIFPMFGFTVVRCTRYPFSTGHCQPSVWCCFVLNHRTNAMLLHVLSFQFYWKFAR